MITTPLIKVAWVRNPGVPPGQPAPGHLRCPCGQAPESLFSHDAGDVRCACGRLYAWNGWLIENDEQPAADSAPGSG